MRFLVDAQLPPALAGLLSGHGHQAEHVCDVGLRDADDTEIWTYCLERGTVIVTKDEDFPKRYAQSPAGAPVIVWIRVGNASRQALLKWFEPLLPEIVGLIAEGERLVEVR